MAAKRRPRGDYFVIVYGGVPYGYSRTLVTTQEAFNRGVRRGVMTTGKIAAHIQRRTTPVHGLHADQFFPPFG